MTPSKTIVARTSRFFLVFILLSGVLLLLGGFTLNSTAAEARQMTSGSDFANCRRETRLVPSPNGGSAPNHLTSVAPVPRRNEREDAPNREAWAVGHYVGQTGVERTLIQHWDGNDW